jgi:uncharacterized protein (DUF3084 family)
MAVSVDGGYDVLLAKAKKLAERRSFLQAQEQSLKKQVDELKASLVKEFGENYQELYSEAVQKIRDWDESHAAGGVSA